MQLTGKVALVTGAGRGIGRGIAVYLAEQDVAVALNDLEASKVQGVAQEIRDREGRAFAVPADIRRVDQIETMVAAVVEQFGRLDILVNNAGIDPRCGLFDNTEEFWDNVLATNLKGAFCCAQAAAREMRKTGSGRIITVSSVHAQTTMANLAAYAASKGGINAMTRQLALDLAPFRITVNAVAPGCVQVEKNTFDPAIRGREIPAGRVGTPRDIAQAIGFLASDAAEWLTGQVVTVDGGSTARLCLDHLTD
jgi:glucose 1-dehydrogenase/3-oxoacyl-[acyl-carrier protein] reductase